jgi:alkane 1-monooxygenase
VGGCATCKCRLAEGKVRELTETGYLLSGRESIVRDPATPVQPRHSWNTTRRISSWTMFNLTRHSHHHAQGEVPYHDLMPLPDAPVMINGYLTTIVVALIPALWHRLMTPKVLAWDRDLAIDEERVLAVAANARSGIAALQEAARRSGIETQRRSAEQN